VAAAPRAPVHPPVGRQGGFPPRRRRRAGGLGRLCPADPGQGAWGRLGAATRHHLAHPGGPAGGRPGRPCRAAPPDARRPGGAGPAVWGHGNGAATVPGAAGAGGRRLAARDGVRARGSKCRAEPCLAWRAGACQLLDGDGPDLSGDHRSSRRRCPGRRCGRPRGAVGQCPELRVSAALVAGLPLLAPGGRRPAGGAAQGKCGKGSATHSATRSPGRRSSGWGLRHGPTLWSRHTSDGARSSGPPTGVPSLVSGHKRVRSRARSRGPAGPADRSRDDTTVRAVQGQTRPAEPAPSSGTTAIFTGGSSTIRRPLCKARLNRTTRAGFRFDTLWKIHGVSPTLQLPLRDQRRARY
jgi:hypothetical protein